MAGNELRLRDRVVLVGDAPKKYLGLHGKVTRLGFYRVLVWVDGHGEHWFWTDQVQREGQ